VTQPDAPASRPEIVRADRDRLRREVSRRLASEADRAIRARGFFALAVPGGSVGREFFPAFATLPLDWTKTRIFWVDERAVPPADFESNFGLARSAWLEPAGVPAECIHRMPADAGDLRAAARRYAANLESVLGVPAQLDLVLLGVGDDGHVASLFPDHAALAERTALVVPIDDAPKPPARRLTLTLPLLTSASLVVVAGFGASKAAVISEALQGTDSALPVALVLRHARRSLVLVDVRS